MSQSDDPRAPSLFDPITIGAITAPNRIFMAPMTRGRGTRDHVPTDIMIDYYTQRASAGLIISEAIGISQQGLGWAYATGLWSSAQIAGWRKVTDAVHLAGGRMIAQLWHMGRTVHPSFLAGAQPVSASITTAPGHAHTYSGKQRYEAARALGREEISQIVTDYQAASRNAMQAGFDGVQLHASNGYLIDQFLRDSDNFRQDEYGGSIANRIRFLRDITEAVVGEIGGDRTGVRLSPNGETQGTRDSDPLPLFTAVLQQLSEIGIAHVELREPPLDGTFGVGYLPPLAAQLRPSFDGMMILNSDFDAGRAQHDLGTGIGDAVSFGRRFIANPDLPDRIKQGLPLSEDDPMTWFTKGADGYTSYPLSYASASR